ncbi:MAG: ABC transporter ATP-binding protein [Clostridia bacterium]|nr:ABC transporter ATP-binding protein [Clostridia bacterium]
MKGMTKSLARLLPRLRPYGAWMAASLLTAVLSSVAQLLVPIYCGQAIDAMVGAGQVLFPEIAKACAAILTAVGICAAAQWVLAVCNNHVAFRVSQDLRNEMMEKLQRLPLSWLDAHPIGDLISRMTADVETLSDGLLMGFTQLFTGLVAIFGTLVMMARMNLMVTAGVVLLTPLSLLTASFIARKSVRWFHAQSAARGDETALINELIDGQRVVQAFGQEERTQEAFRKVNAHFMEASLKATFFSSLVNPTTRLVNNLVYAAVAVAGAMLVPGSVTVGQLSAFLSYASQYAKPFNEISGVVTEMQNALACADRIDQMLDEREQSPDPEPEQPLEHAQGQIMLDRVSFRYVPDRPLIEDFSLEVQPGQRIAIVGPTGCGKTTLINLLMRFYDVDSGAIRVDGREIRSLPRHMLRRQWGMVLQDTWLQGGTVRENIAFGRPDATQAEVEAAARAAHIHSFIQRLPQGYDTVISESGEGISQGQKQLLCIARVMLCLPPMLILDEATSSIDTRTEIRIQAAFSQMMKSRTSFIVAHRLSTIREADVILVMRDGHIVEQGSHEALMEHGGFYATLYNSQFSAS